MALEFYGGFKEYQFVSCVETIRKGKDKKKMRVCALDL